MARGKLWTDSENLVLRDLYPTAQHRELLEALPGRDMASLRTQAHKLGIERVQRNRSLPLTDNMLGHLTEAERAYLAGIFDGEGCISLTRRKIADHHSYVYSVCVHITNTNRNLMDWLMLKVPAAFSIKRHATDRWQTCYYWRLSGNERSRQFLRELLPYLIIKRAQAELVINDWRHYDTNAREAMFTQVRDLKRAG